jgi:hypothetical protein
MTIYAPGDFHRDLLLLDWYITMGRGPDFEQIFFRDAAPIASFMGTMQKCLLIYETDEQGIWFAAWFDAAMSAGAVGLWCREDKRQSREMAQALYDTMEIGLARFPVILFVTRNASILRRTAAFGFVVLGEIPGLFDGETASIAWVNKERFTYSIEKYQEFMGGFRHG